MLVGGDLFTLFHMNTWRRSIIIRTRWYFFITFCKEKLLKIFLLALLRVAWLLWLWHFLWFRFLRVNIVNIIVTLDIIPRLLLLFLHAIISYLVRVSAWLEFLRLLLFVIFLNGLPFITNNFFFFTLDRACRLNTTLACEKQCIGGCFLCLFDGLVIFVAFYSIYWKVQTGLRISNL